MDSQLSFSLHTQRIVNKTKRAIGELCRTIRKWAPTSVFIEAVQKIALPLFLYAVEIWYPPTEREQRRLERLIKFAARLSLNNFRQETTNIQLLNALKWKSVARLVMERRLLSMKKYLDGRRFIPEDVFPLESLPTHRTSQRLRAQRKRETLILSIFKQQKNKLEEKLCAAQMRLL